MNNSYYNVSHSRDYYKGKSVEFAGEWTSGVRYFNDEYLNSLVVYTEKDTTGNIIHSALLACKKTHIAAYNSSIPDSTNNQPHLIVNDNLGIVGIEPNDYWVFVSGSLEGTPGKSAEIVNTYLEALTLASESNIGKIVFVKEEKDAYLIIGAGELKKIVSLPELLELASSKVDKEIGKGLSTNDFSNSEKAKLKGIEESAQRNIIEEINLKGVKIEPVDKVVSINVDSEVTEDSNNLITSGAVYEKLELKQDQLIPGDNITIQDNIISATGRVDLSEYAKTEDVDNKLSTKQDTLIPGNGINIENNEISVTTITESETQPDTSIWVNPTEDTDVIETYNRSQIDALVGSKQDTIDDLDAIREGVNKGITALQPMQNITYSKLVALRDSSSLIAGMQYRITDYTCTTTASETKSAGNVFDIIVTADNENILNEEARAAKHEGDTYFANSELSAWKIQYCLDNDTDRFAWADSTNGKGVIYRMIDEFNNDLPYDFKNIQFKHPNNAATYPYYYYTFASSGKEDNTDYSINVANKCYSNTVEKYISSNKRALNAIIFIGSGCYNNTFGSGCYNNTFGYECHNNTFGTACHRNTFASHCIDNLFVKGCYDNKLSSSCWGNFFGINCGSNKLGSSCSYNTFGSNCYNNTFGFNCKKNSLGNSCGYNSIGNECCYNSFGHRCYEIKFVTDTTGSTTANYYQYNNIDSGARYINLYNGYTASSDSQVQNYHIISGVVGRYSGDLNIEVARNLKYETKIAKNSSGGIVIYCEADIIYSEDNNPEPSEPSEPSQPSYPYQTYFIGDI